MFARLQGVLVPIWCMGVSAVYFLTSPQTESLSNRLLASAHGAAIAAIYLLAMAAFWTDTARREFQGPFLFSLLVPAVFIGLSFFVYRGARMAS